MSSKLDLILKRVAAAIIDLLLLSTLLALVLINMSPLLDDIGVAGVYLVVLALAFLYYFSQEVSSGQTIGKRLLGVRVVSQSGELAMRQVALRTLLRVIDFLPCFYIVGLVAVLVSRDRRRLGDMAAHTRVARA